MSGGITGSDMADDAEQYKGIVDIIAGRYNIPSSLIWAIINIESSCNTWSVRYEPQFRWLYNNNGKIKMTDTETMMQMTSWGLMQVMGAVAREAGFMGRFLSELCDPLKGIEYGWKHLSGYFKKYNNWTDAIASYNAGSPRKSADVKYVNQAYVDKVNLYWGGS